MTASSSKASGGRAPRRRALLGTSGRLLLLVVLVGIASGLVAAGFVSVLRVLTDVLGPEQWSRLRTCSSLPGSALASG